MIYLHSEVDPFPSFQVMATLISIVLCKFALLLETDEYFPLSTFLSELAVTCAIDLRHFDRCKMKSKDSFNFPSLMAKNNEHFFKCFLPFLFPILRNLFSIFFFQLKYLLSRCLVS